MGWLVFLGVEVFAFRWTDGIMACMLYRLMSIFNESKPLRLPSALFRSQFFPYSFWQDLTPLACGLQLILNVLIENNTQLLHTLTLLDITQLTLCKSNFPLLF